MTITYDIGNQDAAGTPQSMPKIASVAVSDRFKLDPFFISRYAGKQPDWNTIGYITYKRTYARFIENMGRTEEYWETILRVVEGVFTHMRRHYQKINHQFDEVYYQNMAQQMYDKMWKFQLLPGGRGLWAMGTDHVEKDGAFALNNCGFCTTEFLNTNAIFPFQWTMNALMLGVGVGFDTLGAGKIEIKKPGPTIDYIISDSRKGWVGGLGALLKAYFYGNGMPKFDYTKIRPKGTRIKGFGGVCEGYESLEKMMLSISKLLDERIGNKITSVDIVDMMDFIAKCVVSGNVRRSALLGLGFIEDDAYVSCKEDVFAANDRRWASNNSIYGKKGMDYTKILDGIIKKGEPGIIWLENAQQYSRMKDPINNIDKDVRGANPCFTGDTLIAVADGRGAVPIQQLAEENKDVLVYSVNSAGKVEIKMGRRPRITGHDQDILKIVLDDESFIMVTPTHKMRLLNGQEIEAQHLKLGDSLPRFYKSVEKIKSDGKDYFRVSCDTLNTQKNKTFEHRLIAKFHYPNEWSDIYNDKIVNGFVNTNGLVVHHKDGNGLNNNLDNLDILSFNDHAKLHGKENSAGEKNPMYGKHHSEKTKHVISDLAILRNSDPTYRENLSESIKIGMDNDETRAILSETRYKELKKYYDEFQHTTDLETVWVDKQLFVKKQCETCKKEMILSIGKRDICFCSTACLNKSPAHIASRKVGQQLYFAEKQRNILHQQIMIYKDLEQTLHRSPSRKEWEEKCKLKGIAFRCNANSENDYVVKGFNDLKQKAMSYNHRVIKIEKMPNRSTVYNITVDDNHTVGIITNHDKDTMSYSGIFTFQCSEISLEPFELCNLCEIFPSNHETYDDFEASLRLALFYTKTVSTISTKCPVTDKIIEKNRRLGISQSGIMDAYKKHGRVTMINWCEKGYDFLHTLDRFISDEWKISPSIKITTVKPSGSISLLAGVSAGIHYPESEYLIRRIRFDGGSEMLKPLADSGYHIEPDLVTPNTVVVSFPMKTPHFGKAIGDATVWEQIENAIDYQRYWSDNQVSVTVRFKSHEQKDLLKVLKYSEDKLKGISLLPFDHGYDQAPLEGISEEQFKKMSESLRPMSAILMKKDGIGEQFCTNDGMCSGRTGLK